MQIRVKNTNKGQRGLYADGDLVFVDAGATSNFTNVSASERDAAAEIDGLRVQSRQSANADWVDHFKEEMPAEKPWLALSNDPNGADYKPLPDGAWYVGMAVAGERPDGAGGYKWVKVGATGPDEGVNGGDEAEADAVDSDTPPVDYAELVKGNAADVIAKVTADNAAAIGDAEEKREGGPRKGVMKAVEDAIG